MIAREIVDAIHAKVARLDANSQAAVFGVIERVGVSDKEALRKALENELKPILSESAQLASELAGAVYNGIRVAEVGESVSISAESSFDDAKFAAMVNTALTKDSAEDVLNVVNGYAGYTNRASYSNTLFSAGIADRLKPRYARVPQGTETCQFCMMLASRGFVYYSGGKGEKVHNHANCDCVYVPSWSKSPSVGGYDKKQWYDKWKKSIEDEAKRSAERKGTTADEESRRIESYYKNSAKNARDGKSRTTWKSDRFDSFDEVREYIQSSSTQEELERRFSELGGIYGFEKMRSTAALNAVKHAQKRIE